MNASHPRIRFAAWIRWLLFTSAGLVAGLVVFIIVGSFLGEAGDEAPPIVFGSVLGVIFGTTFGIAHWLVLRRYLDRIAAWIPASAAAFTLATAVVFALLNGDDPDSHILLKLSHGAVLGLALGAAQWIMVRDKMQEQGYLWILFSVVGWTLGELAGILLTGLAEQPLPLMAVFLLGPSLTGAGYLWLLNRHLGTAGAGREPAD
jgi:hypothetical protein